MEVDDDVEKVCLDDLFVGVAGVLDLADFDDEVLFDFVLGLEIPFIADRVLYGFEDKGGGGVFGDGIASDGGVGGVSILVFIFLFDLDFLMDLVVFAFRFGIGGDGGSLVVRVVNDLGLAV